MSYPARRLGPTVFYLSALIWLASFSSPVRAESYQICETSTTCTIGEYLYDDDYSALPGQTCTLNSKYPDDTAFITNGAMTDRGDGWYSYDATIGTTEGIYSTNICCTPSSGTLCLDKTFEVKSPSLTASEVWASPTRTLTSFGTLVGDVWGYSTRTLSTLGSLISDIWGHTTRTLTGTGNIATKDDVAAIQGSTTTSTTNITINSISQQIAETRAVLEQLVNEPVIQNFIEEGSSPSVGEKIEETRRRTNLIYTQTQTALARTNSLISKWPFLTKTQAADELSLLTQTLNQPESENTDSISNIADWLEKSWKNPVTADIANFSSLASASVLETSRNLSYYGKSSTSTELLKSAANSLTSLAKTIGEASDSASAPTLFGHLRKIQRRAEELDAERSKLTEIFDQMESYSQIELASVTSTREKQILAVNEFKGATSILKNTVKNAQNALKNKLLSLFAILDINETLLANAAGSPLRKIWLEEGSIIFRTAISNPSTTLTQTIPLKFLLPKEVKSEDIMDLDPALSTGYDTEKEAIYVEGEFTLEPEESVIVFVEVEDVWIFSDEELAAYQTQADALLKTLERSELYPQAASLKSDIDVTVAKILADQDRNVNPAARIQTYRRGELELLGIKEKIETLKDLVASQTSARSILGFVGGSQAILAWGLIVIFITGFVFLTLYMRRLQRDIYPQKKTPAKSDDSKPELTQNLIPRSLETKKRLSPQAIPFILTMLITAVVSATALSTYFFYQSRPKPSVNSVEPSIVPSPTTPPAPSPEPSPEPEPASTSSATNSTSALIEVNPGEAITISTKPSRSSDVAMIVSTTMRVYPLGEVLDTYKNSWTRIAFSPEETNTQLWILSSFLTR